MFSSACSSFPRLPRLHGFRRISLIPHLLQSIGENGQRDAVDSVAMHTHCASSVADLPDYEYDKFQDDVKTVEKDAALRLALSRLAGDFGRESMLSFDGFFRSRYAPVIPTGSLKLDVALGIGGLPKGRIVEIYGKEASGKTTLAFHIIKEAQRLGGYCAYLDVENAMVASLAESIGVDTDKLLVARPDSAENSFKIVDTLAKSGSIDVIVVDSVAALVSQCEIDVLMDINVPDARSRLMTQALRKIQYSLVQSRTLLVFINQVRSRPCKGFGRTDEVSSGGNALKFYSAVRLKILRRGLLKNENEITGIGVSVQVEKNKLAPAMKKADLDIIFGRGICCESEVLEMACQHGVILKEGNSYCIEGEIFKSQHEAERHLAENDGILDKVVANLRSQLLFGNTK